jgi:hypothetical protein
MTWQHGMAWCCGLHALAATHPQVHLPQTAFTSYAGEQYLHASAEWSGMQMPLNESCAIVTRIVGQVPWLTHFSTQQASQPGVQ